MTNVRIIMKSGAVIDLEVESLSISGSLGNNVSLKWTGIPGKTLLMDINVQEIAAVLEVFK